MPHRRSSRNRDVASLLLSRRHPLRIETLERRSMLAADMGDPAEFAEISAASPDDDVDRSIAVWHGVVIDPFSNPDCGIVICPPAPEERIAVDPRSFADACDLSDLWDYGPESGESSDTDATPSPVEDPDVLEPWLGWVKCGNQLMVAAMPAPSGVGDVEPTSEPAISTASVTTSDAARLFAAYASSLGQGATEGLSTFGTGGRRSARRAN